jgi:hypothetical protein
MAMAYFQDSEKKLHESRRLPGSMLKTCFGAPAQGNWICVAQNWANEYKLQIIALDHSLSRKIAKAAREYAMPRPYLLHFLMQHPCTVFYFMKK